MTFQEFHHFDDKNFTEISSISYWQYEIQTHRPNTFWRSFRDKNVFSGDWWSHFAFEVSSLAVSSSRISSQARSFQTQIWDLAVERRFWSYRLHIVVTLHPRCWISTLLLDYQLLHKKEVDFPTIFKTDLCQRETEERIDKEELKWR